MSTPHLTRFELTGADGGPLRGDVRTQRGTEARPAVVICHGFRGFKNWGFFPHLSDRLARAGLTTVSFNFSGSGVGPDGEHFSEPERFATASFGNDLDDLRRVTAAVTAGTLVEGLGPPARIGLFGHSRGGGVATLFAARERRIAVLVTWSAVASALRWGPQTIRQWRRDGKLDITTARTGEVLPLATDVLDELVGDAAGRFDIGKAAATLRIPWLVVHGEQDQAVPVADARTLHEKSGGHATLLTVPHGSHTFGARHPWEGSTPPLEQAMDATVEWLGRYLF